MRKINELTYVLMRVANKLHLYNEAHEHPFIEPVNISTKDIKDELPELVKDLTELDEYFKEKYK